MDQDSIIRLKEEQEKAVRSTEEQINTWEKFKSDYVTLQERLKTLPDKVTHQVMVPIGSKAFMPGQLVHTNEILVLLGDNWFADRSAKQASEIIDRRLVGINKQIKDLEKQKDLLQPRIDFTSELQEISQAKSDMVDIEEEYDPEKEKRWRAQHRKNVLQHRRKLKEDKNISKPADKVTGPNTYSLTDEALWARLDELERIERSGQEMSRLGSSAEVNEETLQVSGRTVRWADQETNDPKDRLSSEEESDEGDTTLNRPKSIQFTHTKYEDDSRVSENPKAVVNPGEETVHITSPADIYKLFNPEKSTPTSILKSTSNKMTSDKLATHSKDDQDSLVLKTAVTEAFSGSIVERDTNSGLSTTAESSVPLPSTTSDDDKNQPTRKRVSKFKADRQKQKHSDDR